MKKLISIILPIIVAIGFTACGGGGGGDSSFKQETIAITISCVATPSSNDFASYITLNSGDEIVNDSADANVTTYHNVGGEKKVCLNSGSAHIVRN